jgi:hypothetical protein
MNIQTDREMLFFDTETTGILKDTKGKTFSNGDLIQMAYRKIVDGVIKDVNVHVNTNMKIEYGAIATHGMYKELLEKKS